MKKRRLSQRLLGLYVAFVLIFLSIPIIVVIPSAFSAGASLTFPPQGFSMRWFAKLIEFPEFAAAFYVSMLVAIAATLLSLAIGTLAAFALVRYRFPGREGLSMMFLLPLIFPAVVFGVALVIVFSSLGLVRSIAGLILAHGIITLPYVIRTMSAALYEIDKALEEVAQTLGANWWRTFWYVILPLLRAALTASATFSFIISFDEFTISLFLVGPDTMTLPLQIYYYAEHFLDPAVAAISVVLIAMTALVVWAIDRFLGFERQFQ